RHDGMPGRSERVAHQGEFAHLAAGGLHAPSCCLLAGCGHSLLIETQGARVGRIPDPGVGKVAIEWRLFPAKLAPFLWAIQAKHPGAGPLCHWYDSSYFA